MCIGYCHVQLKKSGVEPMTCSQRPRATLFDHSVSCDWRSGVQGAKDPNAYTSQKRVSEETLHLASFKNVAVSLFAITFVKSSSFSAKTYKKHF